MTSAAISIDYREFEKAGFTKEQTDVLKRAITVIEDTNFHNELIKREIDAAESRLENALIKEIGKLKEELHGVEKRLGEKVYTVEKNLSERIHGVEKNLSFINRIGGFVLGVASVAVTMFSILHAHIVFN